MNPTIYYVMGVSGAGKTTLGRLMADALRLPFIDSDDLHPEANVAKMKSGAPLTDTDRTGWLKAVAEHVQQVGQSRGAVIANSALKQAYRDLLEERAPHPVRWIFLDGSKALLQERLEARKDHFMPPGLLNSQLETLEAPQDAWREDISLAPKQMLHNILRKIRSDRPRFGIAGLGVMGRNLALNLAEKGFPLTLYNRMVSGEEEKVAEQLIASHELLGTAVGFESLEAWVASMPRPRRLLIMIKAGSAVDELMEGLLPLLDAGDVVLDGGNTHYRDTERRATIFVQKGIHWIGLGISGGEAGARKGPSLMPGGAHEAYHQVAEWLEALAARDLHGRPCCSLLGPAGAGHFVKMVHNGIEYGEMQLLAEVYALLIESTGNAADHIAETLETWNKGHLSSYLLEITTHILRYREGNRLLLELIRDEAGQKGTGSWTVEAAARLGVPVPTISAALEARFLSAMKSEREAAARVLPPMERIPHERLLPEQIKDAYDLARRLNHQQGFHLLQVASQEYDWKIDLQEVARLWTQGCIIRSVLMEQLSKRSDDWPLFATSPPEAVSAGKLAPSLRQTVTTGLNLGISLPCLSASVQYLQSMTTVRSTANLIQAQRDYFGAHTYRRTDDPEDRPHHTQWQNKEAS